jgi:phosphatidylserine/phosphatidylglycerophosphate/cardiolipin synthase-like enzyme
MGWHDVHMSLVGPAVLDIVQHFVERWNELKKRKYMDDPRYDWLALPHDIEAAPNEPVARKSVPIYCPRPSLMAAQATHTVKSGKPRVANSVNASSEAMAGGHSPMTTHLCRIPCPPAKSRSVVAHPTGVMEF